MRDVYFNELANAYKAVDDVDCTKIIDAINLVCNFAVIARTEGLLDVEEKAHLLDESSSVGYFRRLLELITLGTDTDELEDRGYILFCSGRYEGIDAILCLLYLRGAPMIQEGVYHIRIRIDLTDFLPPKIRNEVLLEIDKQLEEGN